MGEVQATGSSDPTERPDASKGDFVRRAIAMAFMAYGLLEVWYSTDSNRWHYIVYLIPAVWFAVDTIVHESGHAIAVWMCRWRVYVFAIGPCAYHLLNRDFAYLSRKQRGEFEGYVLSGPTSPEVWTLRRKIVIAAGGAAANLLQAAVAWGLSRQAADWWVGDGWLEMSRLLHGLALISLSTVLANILPFGDRHHDGRAIRSYLKMPIDEWLRWRSFIEIATLLQYDVRLRDLPMWVVDEQRRNSLLAKDNPQLAVSAHTIDIGIILDSPPVDKSQARKYLDEHRNLVGDSEWLAGCDAYFIAVWEGNGEAAQERLWPEENTDMFLRPLTMASRAAVAARLGQVDNARALLAEMRVAVQAKSPFPDHTFIDIGRQIEQVNVGQL